MPDDKKILGAIRKQIVSGSSQYLLVALCAVGAVAHGAKQVINAKFGSVLVPLKRY